MKKKSLLVAMAAGGVAAVAGFASAGPSVTGASSSNLQALPYGGQISPVYVRSLRTGQVHFFDRQGDGPGTRQDLNPVYDNYTLPGAAGADPGLNVAWADPADYPDGGGGPGSAYTVPSGPTGADLRPASPHPDTGVPTSISVDDYFADEAWDAEGPVLEMQFMFGAENPNPFPSMLDITWLFFELVEDPTHGTVVEFRDGVTFGFDLDADSAFFYSVAPIDLSSLGGLELPAEGIVLRDYDADLVLLDGLGVFWPLSGGDADPNAPVFPHPDDLIQVGDNDFDFWFWIGPEDVNPANDAQPPYEGDPNTVSYLDVVLSAFDPADPENDPAPINWTFEAPTAEFPYLAFSSAFPLTMSAEFEGGGFQGCGPADINEDGEVDIQDFFLYLQWFEDQDPRADLNEDGEIDIQDFFLFLDLFELGCID